MRGLLENIAFNGAVYYEKTVKSSSIFMVIKNSKRSTLLTKIHNLI
ncbi:hypothetical protein AAHB61_29670 [Bacillus cereus]